MVVTTSTHSHAGLVIAAAEAGKNVLVEKPLCLTVREADRIIHTVQKSGITFLPLPFDALSGFLKAKDLLSRGQSGRAVAIKATATNNGVFHSGWFLPQGKREPERHGNLPPELGSRPFLPRRQCGRLYQHLHQGTGGSARPLCDPFQQRHMVEIIEKAYRAASTRKVQKLTTRFRV